MAHPTKNEIEALISKYEKCIKTLHINDTPHDGISKDGQYHQISTNELRAFIEVARAQMNRG